MNQPPENTHVPQEGFYGRLQQSLFQPVAIDWLIVYRLAFGSVMLWYSIKFLLTMTVDMFYGVTLYHFPYDGFRWIKQVDFAFELGGQVYKFIHLQYVCMAACSLLILLGLFYRLAAVLFALCFVHIFLLDKCYYQNHYYLVSLLSLQLPFLPANRAFSVDAFLFPEIKRTFVPAWTLWLIRFQIGVPYLLGGLAKLDGDWLRGQPMRMALAGRTDSALVGPFLDQEWCVQLFVWGGMVFDVAVVPALLWKRTRPLAFLMVLGFHLTNSVVWTIGIFPWLMIPATTVFFEPDWPRKFFNLLKLKSYQRTAPSSWQFPRPAMRFVVTSVLLLFVAWQSLFPFRHLVYPGNSNWDEYTHHFSWHMLLRAKDSGLRVYATDPRTQRSGIVDLRSYLTSRQLGVVARDPRMIHQLCVYIAEDLNKKGFRETEVRALALISMNGRKPQLAIDPGVNLAAVPINNDFPDYIVPLHEPYRHHAWNKPLAEWEQHIDLDLPPQMILTQQSGRVEPQVARDGSTE